MKASAHYLDNAKKVPPLEKPLIHHCKPLMCSSMSIKELLNWLDQIIFLTSSPETVIILEYFFQL